MSHAPCQAQPKAAQRGPRRPSITVTVIQGSPCPETAQPPRPEVAQPPVPACMTLIDSRFTAVDEHPVDLYPR